MAFSSSVSSSLHLDTHTFIHPSLPLVFIVLVGASHSAQLLSQELASALSVNITQHTSQITHYVLLLYFLNIFQSRLFFIFAWTHFQFSFLSLDQTVLRTFLGDFSAFNFVYLLFFLHAIKQKWSSKSKSDSLPFPQIGPEWFLMACSGDSVSWHHLRIILDLKKKNAEATSGQQNGNFLEWAHVLSGRFTYPPIRLSTWISNSHLNGTSFKTSANFDLPHLSWWQLCLSISSHLPWPLYI